MISPSSSPDDWAVSIVTDGNNFMLWFDKVLYRDQDGKPHWEVSDVVIIPPLEQEQGFIVSGCFLNNVLDPEIVALVNINMQDSESRWLSNENIVRTWRANQTMGKLENLSTVEIECNAETFLGYP